MTEPNIIINATLTAKDVPCCCCRGSLSRDGYCRRRSCGLFMAEAEEISRLTYRNPNFPGLRAAVGFVPNHELTERRLRSRPRY